jgi:hypothetical protein
MMLTSSPAICVLPYFLLFFVTDGPERNIRRRLEYDIAIEAIAEEDHIEEFDSSAPKDETQGCTRDEIEEFTASINSVQPERRASNATTDDDDDDGGSSSELSEIIVLSDGKAADAEGDDISTTSDLSATIDLDLNSEVEKDDAPPIQQQHQRLTPMSYQYESDTELAPGMNYRISASTAGMTFRYDCDRQLRLSCMPREQSNVYSQYKTNGQKAVLQALFGRGRDFECRMKAVLVAHPKLNLVDLTKKSTATVNQRLIEYVNISTVWFQPEFTMTDTGDVDTVDWLRHMTDANCQLAILTPDFVFAHETEAGDYVDLVIVDAKSSSSLKTEHQVQISVYILGLKEYIRVNRINEQRQHFNVEFKPFRVSSTGGVWLPDSTITWQTDEWELENAPELTDLSVMIDKMAVFLGTHLPYTLTEPLENAPWILSDRCRTCEYVNNCRKAARGALDDTVPHDERVPLITSVPYIEAADLKWCYDMVRTQ